MSVLSNICLEHFLSRTAWNKDSFLLPLLFSVALQYTIGKVQGIQDTYQLLVCADQSLSIMDVVWYFI
jgi:hypothetical protein